MCQSSICELQGKSINSISFSIVIFSTNEQNGQPTDEAQPLPYAIFFVEFALKVVDAYLVLVPT